MIGINTDLFAVWILNGFRMFEIYRHNLLLQQTWAWVERKKIRVCVGINRQMFVGFFFVSQRINIHIYVGCAWVLKLLN